jgi:hypothetical protein
VECGACRAIRLPAPGRSAEGKRNLDKNRINNLPGGVSGPAGCASSPYNPSAEIFLSWEAAMNTETKVLRNASLVGGLIVGLAVVVFLFFPFYIPIKIVSDVFPLLLSISGAVLAFLIYRRQVKSLRGARIWGAMALGLAFFICGEAIWTYYELVLRQDTPYPSVADVAWVIGYIPLFFSIGYQYHSLRASISRRGKLLMAVILLVMILLTVWLVIYPVMSNPGSETPQGIFFDLAYPLEDLVLFGLCIALVETFFGGQLALSWGAIALGILLLSVADILFSYGEWNELYYSNGQLNLLSGAFDIFYISAYVVWNIGLYLRLRLPESGKDVDVQAFVSEQAAPAAPHKKEYLITTDASGRVVFIDPPLIPILGLKNAGEGMGESFGNLVGLGPVNQEVAIRKAEQTGASESYPVAIGPSREKYLLHVSASKEKGELSGLDILLSTEAQPAAGARDQEALLYNRIVNRAKGVGADQRISGEESMLREYVNALIGLLHVLVSRAGGMGVGAAFDAEVNETAKRLKCTLQLTNGYILWGQPSIEPAQYQALLENAIRYSKNVLATSTIDRKLQEIEKYMTPRIVQVAEENRLRMVRWLDDKQR